jgi:hypothetical protein
MKTNDKTSTSSPADFAAQESLKRCLHLREAEQITNRNTFMAKEDLVKATMNLYFVKNRKEGKQNMYMEVCSELGKRVMCFMTDDSERSDHGLTKVLSQHLSGGIEKNHS